jgi:AraC-like DNA-binding protein
MLERPLSDQGRRMTQQLGRDGALELSGSARDYDRWLSFMARHTGGHCLERPLPEMSYFEGRARSRSVQGFTLARVVSSVGRCRALRDDTQIAVDGQDRYGLFLALRGGFEITQFGRNRLIETGSYTFVSAAEPCSFGNGGDNDAIALFLPREFVDQRIVSGGNICARMYMPGRGLHGLVVETLNAFEKNAWGMTDDEFRKSARVIADLVLLAVNGPVDLLSGEYSIRAANLARAKRIIRQRLANPDLVLADVAQESGLSLSYLHDLFRDEGCTMWEYLKGARLQRARELLEASSPRRMTITDISVECGFSSMSYFSTAFKGAFGLSPRDVLRRTHRRGIQSTD